MGSPLEPPNIISDPAAALIGRRHFQVAYVTNDLDRACEVLGARYGLAQFSHLDGDMPAGGTIRVAFAWGGGVMYEIIDARGPGTSFYTGRLRSAEFAVRFHHLGYLVEDAGDWGELRRQFVAADLPIAFETYNPGFMDAIYVHAPELDHYLEYILAEPEGLAFFAAVPAN